ncbi:MAG: RNA 2',3'-cyclic phosphodiesterase [Chloroflexia bacterium]
MTERIRTFLAVEIPASVQQGLARVQEQLKHVRPPVRWVAPHQIHLTLNFLGEIPAQKLPAVQEAARQAAGEAAPFELEAIGLGTFPNLRRPRVVWVGLGGELEALHRLQARLSEELAARGFPPEERPFSPHLTLGRVRPQARPEEARALGQAIAGIPSPSLGRWRVEEIRVMRSDLRPEGPLYTVLYTAPLGRGAGDP